MKAETWRRAMKTAAVLACVTVLLVIMALPEHRLARKYPDRREVVFWHAWSAQWKDVVDRIVERFNESQNEYEVTALSLTDSGDAKFLLSVAGGSPPDVMAQGNSVIPVWAERGAIVPLDEFMTAAERNHVEKTLFPVVWDIGAYKGRLYGLCTAVGTKALYYRPSHFADAGLDPEWFPETTAELGELATRLTRRNDQGQITRLGFLADQFLFWAPSFGGGFYDDRTDALTIETPDNLRALEWLQSFYTDRYPFDQVVRFASSLQQGPGALDWPFITGAYSIVLDGNWRIEQLAKFAPELDYRTAPLPRGDNGGREKAGYCWGNFMIIPSGAACPEGAWAFMRFWSGLDDPETAAEFYTWGGWLPINQEIADTATYRAYLDKYPEFRTFVDMLAGDALQVAPPVIYQNYFLQRLWAMEQRVLRLAATPEEGLQELAQEMAREKAHVQE